jgi:hypothetical protein
MGYDGFLAFGGIEIINAARTTAYINNLMPSFPLVRRTNIYDQLHTALEQEPYRTPFLDQADWVDLNLPDYATGSTTSPTHGFYGLYPLAITGIGDSTMSAAVTEGILDGGSINSERDSTRSIRVRGILVGANKLAVEAGLTWLRNALRRNSCGMHGDLCGYADLRFLLAPPEVCDPKWESAYENTELVDMGPIDPASSPLVYVDGEETRPTRTRWVLPLTDGVIIRWEARSWDNTELLETHGPLFLRRSNFVPNPTFAVDATNWTMLNDATPAGTPTRKVGMRTYGRVGEAIADISTNWLPDPGFENGDPTTNGWRSTTAGGITAVTDGTAPDGTHVARVAGIAGLTMLEVSALGPYDPADMYFNLQIKQSVDDVVVHLIDNHGVELESHTVLASALTSTWNATSVHFTATVLKDYVIRLTTAGTQELRIDSCILAITNAAFFSGDTGASAGNVYSFPNGFAGVSRKVHANAVTASTALTVETDSPFGNVIVSTELRAPHTEPTVLMELIDHDGFVVASQVVTPPRDWTRYAFSAPYGRTLRLRVSSAHQFDISKVMLEAGTQLNAYFDGSFAAPAGYTLVWVGAPNGSISRMDWTGDTEITLSTNFRSMLYVDQGTINNAQVDVDYSNEIPMSVQVDPYDRTYHRVACTTGISRIRDIELGVGAATEVDFVLTAATPHAFQTIPTDLSFVTPVPTTISDEEINLVKYPSGEKTTGTTVDLTNIVTNPSAESGTTGFTALPGTTGVAACTNPVPSTTTAFGAKVLKTTWSTASTAGSTGVLFTLAVGSLTAGTAYSFGISHVKSSINQRLRLAIDWKTAGGSTISTDLSAAPIDVVAGTIYNTFKMENFVAPATTSYAILYLITATGGSFANMSIGAYYEVDGLMMVNASVLPTWFSGATVAAGDYTFAWTGTAELSSSQRLTPHADGQYPFTGVADKGAAFRTSAQFKYGTHATRYVWHVAPAEDSNRSFGSSIVPAEAAVVVPLQTYTGSIWVRPSKTQSMRASLWWMDAAGAPLGESLGTTASRAGATWVRLSATGAAPVGAVRAAILAWSITPGTGYSRWVAEDYVDIDGEMIHYGDPSTTFFDGDTIDTSAYDYSWDGVAQASQSRRVFHVVTPSLVVDPDLPVVPTTPAPPTIPDLAIVDQNEWLRYAVEIPAGLVPLWAATVPTITLLTKTTDVRQVRVRFHANPFGRPLSGIDPSDYCGEFLLSYLPANSALTVNGVTQEAYAVVAGAAPVPASHLLYGTGGTPMVWPDLSCALSYWMTIDILPTSNVANLTFDMVFNRRE